MCLFTLASARLTRTVQTLICNPERKKRQTYLHLLFSLKNGTEKKKANMQNIAQTYMYNCRKNLLQILILTISVQIFVKACHSSNSEPVGQGMLCLCGLSMDGRMWFKYDVWKSAYPTTVYCIRDALNNSHEGSAMELIL